MSQSHKEGMTTKLNLICLILMLVVCFFLLTFVTGIAALADFSIDKMMLPFVANQVAVGLLAVAPLLIFIKLVQAVVRAKEFFSRTQSKRMLLIAVCLLLRVAVDLLAPRIEVPSMLGGAIGPMSVGPSLNLTTLATSIMFFALAGVFEYGRKLQEDSDNIL